MPGPPQRGGRSQAARGGVSRYRLTRSEPGAYSRTRVVPEAFGLHPGGQMPGASGTGPPYIA